MATNSYKTTLRVDGHLSVVNFNWIQVPAPFSPSAATKISPQWRRQRCPVCPVQSGQGRSSPGPEVCVLPAGRHAPSTPDRQKRKPSETTKKTYRFYRDATPSLCKSFQTNAEKDANQPRGLDAVPNILLRMTKNGRSQTQLTSNEVGRMFFNSNMSHRCRNWRMCCSFKTPMSLRTRRRQRLDLIEKEKWTAKPSVAFTPAMFAWTQNQFKRPITIKVPRVNRKILIRSIRSERNIIPKAAAASWWSLFLMASVNLHQFSRCQIISNTQSISKKYIYI